MAHVLADVALLVLHLAGGPDGVDVGGAVHHLAAELRRVLRVPEAELVQAGHEEHVGRDVDQHPDDQGQREVGVGEVRDVQVGEQPDDPGEELPEPLRDELLRAVRGVRDLVDEGARVAVAEVRGGVLREIPEQAAVDLRHHPRDPAHAAEAAGAPDHLVAQVDGGKEEGPAPDVRGPGGALAEGDRGVGQELQDVGHEARGGGGDQHRQHRAHRPPRDGGAHPQGERDGFRWNLGWAVRHVVPERSAKAPGQAPVLAAERRAKYRGPRLPSGVLTADVRAGPYRPWAILAGDVRSPSSRPPNTATEAQPRKRNRYSAPREVSFALMAPLSGGVIEHSPRAGSGSGIRLWMGGIVRRNA